MASPTVFSRIFALLVAGSIASGVTAQTTTEAQVQTPIISLELNNASSTADAGCQLTFVVTNHSQTGLKQIAYQVGVFDAEGIVRRILVMEFGALTRGKTKIALFNLADQQCSNISRIIVNDVAQCTLSENSEAADFCLSGLSTKSRTGIEFGL